MPETADGKRQHLETLLRTLMLRAPIMQAILALETMDGSFRWAAAAGETTASGRPMQAGTPFFLASIDKLLNATIVMKLAEGGQLDLDERLCTYLPPALTREAYRDRRRRSLLRPTSRRHLSRSRGCRRLVSP